MIKKKNIDLEIIVGEEFKNKEILCDWKLYKLILFNVV